MNPYSLGIVLCSGGIVVCFKALFDSFKGEDNFKYDTVTDLRIKRKIFNDKHYKNSVTKGGNSKGIWIVQ